MTSFGCQLLRPSAVLSLVRFARSRETAACKSAYLRGAVSSRVTRIVRSTLLP